MDNEALHDARFFETGKIPTADITYSGLICSSSIENLGKIVRCRMELAKVSLAFSEYVFSVFVELMINVAVHSTEKVVINQATRVSKGTFMISFDGNECRVYCKNLMKTQYIEPLKEKIEYLNALDKPSLRKFYKEKLRVRIDNWEQKGAGLGLLEVARRASVPIEYSFLDCGDGVSCFTVCVTLNKGDVENDEAILFGDT